MDAELLLVDKSDGVLRVTLNRPDQRNALSQALLSRLADTFGAYAADGDVRVAVLRGAGDRSFAAGGDLKELDSVRSREAAADMARRSKAALGAVRAFPVPVVAALNGDALGGGSELAVACDFRIAAAGARIGFVQGRLNLSTAWGGGIDLMRLVGPTRGLALLGQARMVGGDEAVALGLFDAVAAAGQGLDEAVDDFVAPLSAQAPQVLRAYKALALAVRRGRTRVDLEALETDMFVEAWVHDDHWAAAEKLLDGWR